ncbi:MAG: HlyD family efflux transporter periplasmic adaptor subunit [Arcobacteraceae bacterium]|jgi:HlyD family secretion protein|nr:HlyD family efflux transporter periplasmic adaptor subunit [Arcobacteraceae bacterium]
MLKKVLIVIGLIAFTVGVYKVLDIKDDKSKELQGIAYGNGRIEANEIAVTAKVGGKLLDVYVKEGDMVYKGQVLAKVDTKELDAKLNASIAQIEQAKENRNYLSALSEQKESELHLAHVNYLRSQKLYKTNSISLLQLQQDEKNYKTANAALKAAKANIAQADAAIESATSQAQAIRVNIEDSTLYSPIDGRVLYKLNNIGEVIASGQKVLVVLDLLDTYMNIFLPTAQVGIVNYDSEARIILDALPHIAIPAKVTFISPKAQFTPKQIETQDEREKLMFKVKVTIDYELLKEHIDKVKTGLPGVTYIKLDTNASWPDFLNNLPKGYENR